MDTKVRDLVIDLDRDLFLRNLLRELAGTLEDVVGFDEASGFISVVGRHIGEWIDASYRTAVGQDKLRADQIPTVLVDLKNRINGDFYLISIDDERIVLGNRRCPFEGQVKDRNSLCMMTSNVLGTITADNLGYAKVALQETIARGDPGCRIVIHLNDSEEARKDDGNEYFGL